ncbi:MAG: thiosulfate oxidation carrier complex protein SoxZ [Rhodospirillales bacterium]|jgi:sulfur-oxidizing protein SoxZ|nr:thiosulfate oxidation carrier complex protein SoxZ [Rhodospirillales bacterium]
MANNVKPRVRVQKTATKGEVVEIKTLISHNMESGRRKGKDGKLVPRSIINKFTVTFNGKPVFSSDWAPSISANPYMSFFAKVNESGEFAFKWMDDDGSVYDSTAKITVA